MNDTTQDPPSTPKAIETFYAGCRFRSRLEARWAVFLDELKIAWEYEPEGFNLGAVGRYLPDFFFPQVGMYGEVKPEGQNRRKVQVPEQAIQKARALAIATNCPVIFLDGMPRDTNYWAAFPWIDLPGEWGWEDVVLTEINQYHLSEGRFYACTGGVPLVHDWKFGVKAHPAVVAARSARFGT
jgi:hypothetical protein